MPDELSQLYQASFRGVPFPLSSVEEDFTHDGPEHKIFRLDVSNVEHTGRNSRLFHAQIPFINGIQAGQHEPDLRGKVFYPDLYKKFKLAMADGSSGPLVHPDVGQVTVKPRSFRSRIDPMHRGGLFVDATWIETREASDGTAPPLDAPSPITAVEIEGSDLDDLVGNMNPPPEPADGDEPFPSFQSLSASIRAIFDQTELQTQLIGGAIDNMAAELDRLEDSVDRLNNTANWPVKNSIAHLRSSLHDLAVSETPILKFYKVPVDTTIASIAQTLSALGTPVSVQTLTQLNPDLLDSPIVAAGTVVVYK